VAKNGALGIPSDKWTKWPMESFETKGTNPMGNNV
jgi:hypothetical protein